MKLSTLTYFNCIYVWICIHTEVCVYIINSFNDIKNIFVFQLQFPFLNSYSISWKRNYIILIYLKEQVLYISCLLVIWLLTIEMEAYPISLFEPIKFELAKSQDWNGGHLELIWDYSKQEKENMSTLSNHSKIAVPLLIVLWSWWKEKKHNICISLFVCLWYNH